MFMGVKGEVKIGDISLGFYRVRMEFKVIGFDNIIKGENVDGEGKRVKD